MFRLTECKVVSGDHEVFLIHSFSENNAVCFDNSRLNVIQTGFGSDISFSMRTFRFIVEGASPSDAQAQTIHCDLHLEANESVPENQACGSIKTFFNQSSLFLDSCQGRKLYLLYWGWLFNSAICTKYWFCSLS